MATLEQYFVIRRRIQSAISEALNTTIADGLKGQIAETAEEKVYKAYEPKFLSRRKAACGLIDPGNMHTEVTGNTLTLTNITPLQNLFGGNRDDNLVNVVEDGYENFHMPFPREFMQPALDEYIESGKADRALADVLRAYGFEVTVF